MSEATCSPGRDGGGTSLRALGETFAEASAEVVLGLNGLLNFAQMPPFHQKTGRLLAQDVGERLGGPIGL